jgi:deoxycytidine triphosphate deaminase
MENSQNISGMLSDTDIKKLILKNEIIITHFNEKNLTPLGYNLTPTEFILSIKNQLLVKIYNEKFEKYCYIEPNDTVLILTRESIAVSQKLAGTFHSKVGMVSLGFGHISTTLDPLWRGPLLISLNNPTNKRIKFTLAQVNKVHDPYSNDIDYTYVHKSFITLIFHKLISASEIEHDNKPGRFDQLKNIVKEQVKPKWWEKVFFLKKKNQHFSKLKELIDIIGSIKYTQSFSSIDNALDVQKFYKNHENFTELLKFYTDKAHETSSEIIEKKNWKLNLFFIFRSLTGISVIIFMYFSVWNMIIEKYPDAIPTASVALFVSSIPLYGTIIHPYLIKPLKFIFERKDIK